MTNLFCNQIRKLSLQDLGDGGKGSKKSSRCGFHTKGTKRSVSMFSWIETWYGMVDECREEMVLLPFASIRATLDTYLRRHKFCTDCKGAVNKAYKLLIDTGEVIYIVLVLMEMHYNLYLGANQSSRREMSEFYFDDEQRWLHQSLLRGLCMCDQPAYSCGLLSKLHQATFLPRGT